MRKTAALVAMAVVLAAVIAALFCFDISCTSLWGKPLEAALKPVIDGKDSEKSLVARALLGNYQETRRLAAIWSGFYWGFAGLSAVLGALAGLILKLESVALQNNTKKDLAAFLAFTAAILVTVSTSGDFQRKWQANRSAAADIERDAYDFLEKDGAGARAYLGKIGESLHKRHVSILGTGEQNKGGSPAPSQAPSAPVKP